MSRPAGARAAVAVLAALATSLGATNAGASRVDEPPRFSTPVALPGALGGTEPRLATARNGDRYAIASGDTSDLFQPAQARVYTSPVGTSSWWPVRGALPGQAVATPDVDIVVTQTGRLIVAYEDAVATSVVVSYSDDRGATWRESRFVNLPRWGLQDRPWLATGPFDPATHQPRVYLAFHVFAVGYAGENMYVASSRDDGTNFDSIAPVTPPGSQAFFDLQCADDPGPSSFLVNKHTGQLYLFWGTRRGQAGGCGTLPAPPQTQTYVFATRIWAATSTTGALGSWRIGLAVDESGSGHVVQLPFSSSALDNAGNVFLAYPETPHRYPDLSGAAVLLRRAGARLATWSAPVVVAVGNGPGQLLVHVMAGSSGAVAVAYFAGRRVGGQVGWYPEVTLIRGPAGRRRTWTASLQSVPTYLGTASEIMGVCDPGGQNETSCGRSSDTWGMGLDNACRVMVAWPSTSSATAGSIGAGRDATWFTTQTSGFTIC